MSRMIPVAGSLLRLLVGAISSFAMLGEFRLIAKEPKFGSKDIVVYVLKLTTTVLRGGLTRVAPALVSGFRSKLNKVEMTTPPLPSPRPVPPWPSR